MEKKEKKESRLKDEIKGRAVKVEKTEEPEAKQEQPVEVEVKEENDSADADVSSEPKASELVAAEIVSSEPEAAEIVSSEPEAAAPAAVDDAADGVLAKALPTKEFDAYLSAIKRLVSRKKVYLGSLEAAEQMVRGMYTSNKPRFWMEFDAAIRSRNTEGTPNKKEVSVKMMDAAFRVVLNEHAIPEEYKP